MDSLEQLRVIYFCQLEIFASPYPTPLLKVFPLDLGGALVCIAI